CVLPAVAGRRPRRLPHLRQHAEPSQKSAAVMLRRWLFIAVLGQTAWSAPPVCVTCHPKETNRFLASAMGRSIGPADVIPGGRAVHAASSSVLIASFRGSQLFHAVTERTVTAEYPVALQIGRGIAARTYAVKVGDY